MILFFYNYSFQFCSVYDFVVMFFDNIFSRFIGFFLFVGMKSLIQFSLVLSFNYILI